MKLHLKSGNDYQRIHQWSVFHVGEAGIEITSTNKNEFSIPVFPPKPIATPDVVEILRTGELFHSSYFVHFLCIVLHVQARQFLITPSAITLRIQPRFATGLSDPASCRMGILEKIFF